MILSWWVDGEADRHPGEDRAGRSRREIAPKRGLAAQRLHQIGIGALARLDQLASEDRLRDEGRQIDAAPEVAVRPDRLAFHRLLEDFPHRVEPLHGCPPGWPSATGGRAKKPGMERTC